MAVAKIIDTDFKSLRFQAKQNILKSTYPHGKGDLAEKSMEKKSDRSSRTMSTNVRSGGEKEVLNAIKVSV